MMGAGKRTRLIGIVAVTGVLIGTGVGLWFWTSETKPPSVRIDADDNSLVAEGRKIYRDHCASCHGAKLEGQPDWRVRKADGKLPAPPHDETGHTWHHPDDQLFRLTKDGVKPPLVPEGYQSDMPGFGEVLTDDQIRAALAFIKSTWSPAIRARQARIDEATRKQSSLKGEKE